MVGFETAEDLEKRGHTAFVEEDFDEAVNLYTEALSLEPSNASLYITRAAAHTKLENYTGNSGWILDFELRWKLGFVWVVVVGGGSVCKCCLIGSRLMHSMAGVLGL
jgi:hypothetical protein